MSVSFSQSVPNISSKNPFRCLYSRFQLGSNSYVNISQVMELPGQVCLSADMPVHALSRGHILLLRTVPWPGLIIASGFVKNTKRCASVISSSIVSRISGSSSTASILFPSRIDFIIGHRFSSIFSANRENQGLLSMIAFSCSYFLELLCGQHIRD